MNADIWPDRGFQKICVSKYTLSSIWTWFHIFFDPFLAGIVFSQSFPAGCLDLITLSKGLLPSSEGGEVVYVS
jgi:hypothetical protein